MWAILSDIHGNLEALQAVLQDISAYPSPVDRIICLGDIVGYGPNPVECLDLVRDVCTTVILGNHDQAVMFTPEGFGAAARRSLFWSRDQLEGQMLPGQPVPSHEEKELRWKFLADLPRMHPESGVLFVHGSPRNPTYEYVFPEDIYNERKMQQNFDLLEPGDLCFAGRTHIPGVFFEGLPPGLPQVGSDWNPNRMLDGYNFLSPGELEGWYEPDGDRAIINVGSVGQPRDGDPRACYVLFDGEAILYRRVEYDMETTIRKIRDIDGLDDFSGDRLRDGR